MCASGSICLPECGPNCTGRGGKGICLNGSPLGGNTPLPARDPVLLHLTLHSIPPLFTLLTISPRFGEAADVLTPSNLTIIFEGIGLLVLTLTFEAIIEIAVGAEGWLMNPELFFFFHHGLPANER